MALDKQKQEELKDEILVELYAKQLEIQNASKIKSPDVFSVNSRKPSVLILEIIL